MSTPFELRTNILAMAKDLVEQQFNASRDLAMMQFNAVMDIAKSAPNLEMPKLPTLPSFPSIEDVMAAAEKFNMFVSKK